MYLNYKFRKGNVTQKFRAANKEDAQKCLSKCLPNDWQNWEFVGTDNISNFTSVYEPVNNSYKGTTGLQKVRLGRYKGASWK